jgi:hypothetical protein
VHRYLFSGFLGFNYQGPQRTQGGVGFEMLEPALLQGLPGRRPLGWRKPEEPSLRLGGEEVSGDPFTQASENDAKGSEAAVGIRRAAVNGADDAVQDGG